MTQNGWRRLYIYLSCMTLEKQASNRELKNSCQFKNKVIIDHIFKKLVYVYAFLKEDLIKQRHNTSIDECK